jgi:hypothetical protein
MWDFTAQLCGTVELPNPVTFAVEKWAIGLPDSEYGTGTEDPDILKNCNHGS